MRHRWTPEGVVVEADFTGAHLYHLAPAGCLLNDVYREAERIGIPVDGVRVRLGGAFDWDRWSSTGVVYDIEVDSAAEREDIERLLVVVDEVAEIPKVLRSPTTVTRQSGLGPQ